MTRFNLRVYAFILNDKKEVLLSDEFEFNTFFTKFPGGGVEYGEGILDALKRELSEELNVEIASGKCIYFNDFYKNSQFHENTQLVSFYYLVNCRDISHLGTENYSIPFDSPNEKQRWVNLNELDQKDLTFEIDQKALRELKNYFSTS